MKDDRLEEREEESWTKGLEEESCRVEKMPDWRRGKMIGWRAGRGKLEGGKMRGSEVAQ
jgi:hypothetical protein